MIVFADCFRLNICRSVSVLTSRFNAKQAETIIDLVKGTKMREKKNPEPLRTSSGVYVDNHNDENEGKAQLADLPVADELADETKGSHGHGHSALWLTSDLELEPLQ